MHTWVLKNWSWLSVAVVAPFFTLFTACAYQFTNSHIIRPEGIETIAIEAVYDTSREVIPHEILWSELQSAFAVDGHLRLAPRQTADALLRAHIKAAQISARGSIESQDVDDKDPKFEYGEIPPGPDKFRRLTQAGEIRDGAQLALVVEVEVVSLRTKELLLRRNYAFSRNFRAVHAQSDDTAVTTVGNDFLRYEEAIEVKMQEIAQDLSRNVVKDLLVR
jgi:hypothetical protein